MKANLRIFKDVETLSKAAAEMFLQSSSQAIKSRGCFLVALSGGSTPSRLYRLLAEDPIQNQIEWDKVFVFWGDERCVLPDDPESNYRQAMDTFLSHVSIPETNILRIKGELEPAEASIVYAQTLSEFSSPPLNWPRFDFVLLGMGADGHTASLFPGSEIAPTSPTLSVTADYQGRPANRVTLTPMVINGARQVIFLVTGANKAITLNRVLNDISKQGQYPAQRIQPTDGMVTWLVDEPAAAKLDKNNNYAE